MSSHSSPGGEQGQKAHSDLSEDSIDLRELFFRLTKGLFQIIGLTLIGMVAAAVISLVVGRVQPAITVTRVTFSFPGFERGQYPDRSKFQPDDLRAPAIISEALSRQGLDTSSTFQSKIRGALGIEGIVPANILKERDRLRAAGQTPPSFIPDEYVLTLSLNPSSSFSTAQREKLLNEIVTVYRENFYRTYGQSPLAFGTAFDTLKTADLAEYELVFNSDIENIRSYLAQQSGLAKSFRSPTTNFSFKDLEEQTELFSQIQLNEVLAIVHQNGLSRNRASAIVKMNYHLRLLEEREKKALEDEKLVRDLLSQAQNRASNYVLGVKSQGSQQRADSPVLDQGLIDSILANDSYNFLVRQALDAGLKVKQVQAEKNRLIAQRDNIKSFITETPADQSAIISQANTALKNLESAYNTLTSNIRKTHADFSAQEYGNAIRLSDEIRTPGFLRPMAISAIVGAFLGFALGTGLSLLGIYLNRTPKTA
ncbi:MAG: hypothetical protein QM760_13555 [Nibricoccus sp.]